AHDGGENGQHDEDPADQHSLVVSAEGADREVLDRGRGEVNGQLPDRNHGRAVGADQPGDKLGHAQCQAAGQDPGDGTADKDPGGTLVVNSHSSNSLRREGWIAGWGKPIGLAATNIATWT